MNIELWLHCKETGWKKRCDSLLANFLNILSCQMAQDTRSIVDVNGAGTPVNPSQYQLQCDAPNNNSAYGLLFGTGYTPIDIEDYKLESKIEQGVIPGYLDYGATSITPFTRVGNGGNIAIVRQVSNISGSSITIYEVGLYVFNLATYACIVRELPGGIVVAPAQTRTFTLVIQITA